MNTEQWPIWNLDQGFIQNRCQKVSTETAYDLLQKCRVGLAKGWTYWRIQGRIEEEIFKIWCILNLWSIWQKVYEKKPLVVLTGSFENELKSSYLSSSTSIWR